MPTKAGYSGAWQQYTEAIHADITIQATYTALAQYTVKFVADGVTVKTMTVYEGYVLKTADYPTVPEKAGYSGSWRRRTTAITSDVTIQAVYTVIQHNVKFVVLRRTVKTLTVSDGYILHSGDYPTLPDGYGWTRNTDPIHSDITVTAIEGTSKPLVTFTGNGVTAKIMAVNRGYKLKDSDYPSVPEKKGYLGTWTKYTDAIYEDITVTATYKRSEIIKPPIRPTGVVASEDLPEPIEPQDVIKPEDNAETLSNRPNQTLVSTQTITHEYLTLSGKVARETVKKNGSVTDVLDFVYDESGRPFAMIYQAGSASNTLTTYYYVLNLQGDIVKLVTSSGSVVATYEYDAWGNILSQSGEMASINPLRYRGYYYDTETGFYYLQSRYYDSVNRRFINADSYASTGQGFIGANMFAYCGNNPVRRIDSAGMNWFEDIWESISSWANDTFGASASAEYQVKREKEYSPMFLNLFLTIKKGVKETLTKSVSGDSSKPTSVYAIARHDNYLLSSVGIKRNYPNGSATLSIGFDDIGFSGAYTDKNVTYSGGITIDISQLKVGVQIAKTIKQRDNLSITSYTNVSITVAGILAVVAYATTGQDDLLQGFQPA